MTKQEAFNLVFDIPAKYADIYTIDEFMNQVDRGSINDYDGTGYLAVEIDNKFYEVNRNGFMCHYPWLEAMKEKGFTHVSWYGK